MASATGTYWELKPTGTDARLRRLSAVPGQVAWASGSQGTVLRTVNAGRTWESVGPPGTEALEFRDIEAFDARNAVALSIGAGESSRIYRTSDGGKTWQEEFRNTDPKALFSRTQRSNAETTGSACASRLGIANVPWDGRWSTRR